MLTLILTIESAHTKNISRNVGVPFKVKDLRYCVFSLFLSLSSHHEINTPRLAYFLRKIRYLWIEMSYRFTEWRGNPEATTYNRVQPEPARIQLNFGNLCDNKWFVILIWEQWVRGPPVGTQFYSLFCVQILLLVVLVSPFHMWYWDHIWISFMQGRHSTCCTLSFGTLSFIVSNIKKLEFATGQ